MVIREPRLRRPLHEPRGSRLPLRENLLHRVIERIVEHRVHPRLPRRVLHRVRPTPFLAALQHLPELEKPRPSRVGGGLADRRTPLVPELHFHMLHRVDSKRVEPDLPDPMRINLHHFFPHERRGRPEIIQTHQLPQLNLRGIVPVPRRPVIVKNLLQRHAQRHMVERRRIAATLAQPQPISAGRSAELRPTLLPAVDPMPAVVRHDIPDHQQPPPVSLPHQCFQLLHRAERRLHLVKIRRRIRVVLPPAIQQNRRNPHRRRPQRPDVIQLRRDPRKIPAMRPPRPRRRKPPARIVVRRVAIGKAVGEQLINTLLPPKRRRLRPPRRFPRPGKNRPRDQNQNHPAHRETLQHPRTSRPERLSNSSKGLCKRAVQKAGRHFQKICVVCANRPGPDKQGPPGGIGFQIQPPTFQITLGVTRRAPLVGAASACLRDPPRP
jgi:hypothetical protein